MNTRIYIVSCYDYDEEWVEKAFIREDMAELYADKMNAEIDYNGFWASVGMIELVE